MHITEYNSSYRPDNPIHDTAFHAAYLAPVVTRGGDLVDSFSYWTFCDVFEEVGIPTALFHGGFGLLTHRQIKKPTYHLYAFLARMGDQILARGRRPPGHPGHRRPGHGPGLGPGGRDRAAAGPGVDRPDPVARCPSARRSARRWGAAASAFLLRSSVSEEQGNAWAAWCEMGCPRSPAPRQLDALREAAEPARSHRRVPLVDGRAELDLTLGRHEVTLVELTAVTDETPPWDRPRPSGLPAPGD